MAEASSVAVRRCPVSVSWSAEFEARGLQILGDAAVGVGDRVAHAHRAGDQRVAMVGHLGDQRADAALAVGIGALKRRDFRLDPGLELGRAGERPLDAVAH